MVPHQGLRDRRLILVGVFRPVGSREPLRAFVKVATIFTAVTCVSALVQGEL
jgi:hypothetical protein